MIRRGAGSDPALLAGVGIAALSVLAGFLLLILHLHFNGFWVDELYTLHAVNSSSQEMTLERLRRGHFPLYYVLAKGFVGLSGAPANEATLRLFSVSCWLAAMASFGLLAKKVPDSKGAAIGVTLFALNQLALHQGIQARGYELVLLETVWATRAHWEVSSDPRRTGWKIIYLLSVLCAFWTSASFAIVFAAFIYDAWRRRAIHPELLRTSLIALTLSLLSAAPALLFHAATRERNEIAHTTRINFLLHFGTLLAGTMGEEGYVQYTRINRVVEAAGLTMATILLRQIWKRRRFLSNAESFCVRVILIPPAIMAASYALSKILRLPISVFGPARYLIGALPCGAMLAGGIVTDFFPRRPRIGTFLHAALAIILTAGATVFLRTPTEPFRELIGKLARDYRDGDGLICVPSEIADGVRLYFPGVKIDLEVDRYADDQTALTSALAPLASRKTVWMVWYHGNRPDLVEAAEKLFGPCESSNNKRKIGVLRLLRFTPAARPPT